MSIPATNSKNLNYSYYNLFIQNLFNIINSKLKDKNNTLKKNIKYAPSVALFYKGELSKYLDATNEHHIPYYETTSGFTSWIETYIDIKNTSN